MPPITADANRLPSALRAALAFAARGWPVFPCKPGSKEPATAHGFKDATTNEIWVRRWWQQLPWANLAIPTGTATVDVLDVDVRTDGNGWASLERLRRAGLLARALATVRTPSGGLHIYYRGTAQPSGRLPSHHLDFKATGGYVLVPPSIVSGLPYEWIDRRTDGYGRRLVWQTIRSALEPPRVAATHTSAASSNISRLVRWVAEQTEGNRNSGLYWAARRMIETGHRTEVDRLVDAAARAGLDKREARRTVESAARWFGGAS